jgi:chromosome segregation ATPase
MTDRKRININIPMNLYQQIAQSKYTLTEAITEGLILLLSGSSKNNENEINHDILNLQESRINDLQTHNETLIRELEDLKRKEPENENVLQLHEARIKDLQDQIRTNQDQLKEKDEQLKAQAIHIQTLLNQKSIEAPGAKKPWWRFW